MSIITTDPASNSTALVGSKDFTLIEEIRDGTLSRVVKAYKNRGSVDKGRVYAVKAVLQDSKLAKRNYRQEVALLTLLQQDDEVHCHHPFITPMVYNFVEGPVGFLVFPLAHSDLMDLLVDNNAWLTEDEAVFYLCELLLALDHIHSRGIVHLDIKLENVLVTKDGHVQLTDFDRAFELRKRPETKDFQGTLNAMAPEVARGSHLSPRSDLWSLGVLAATLVAGPPSSITADMPLEVSRSLARSGRHLSIPATAGANLSPGYLELVITCLRVDDNERPASCERIRETRLFCGVDWSRVVERRVPVPFLPALPGDVKRFRKV